MVETIYGLGRSLGDSQYGGLSLRCHRVSSDIEISRSDGPQKGLADVDLTHLESYLVIHIISIAVLGHSKSL